MKNKQAFTLIELLVVVLIIGILAAVALPQYERAVMKSRYSALMANVKALYEAEELYYMSNGEYTNDLEALSMDLTGCTMSNDKRKCVYPWGQCVLDVVANGRVACANTTTLNSGYAHYLPHGVWSSWGRTCWDLDNDASGKYSKLCRSVGATRSARSDFCTGFGMCRMYSF